jgi:dCMP deaminase
MNRWDKYYWNIANAVASNSQCLSRNIGALLVRDKSIIATGYNGPARGIKRCDLRNIVHDDKLVYTKTGDSICPRRALGYHSGKGLHICIAAHAEVNCIANAARHGVCTLNSTMYMTCEVPCKDCMAVIINAGVTELVVSSLKFYDEQAELMVNSTRMLVRDYKDNIYKHWRKGTL